MWKNFQRSKNVFVCKVMHWSLKGTIWLMYCCHHNSKNHIILVDSMNFGDYMPFYFFRFFCAVCGLCNPLLYCIVCWWFRLLIKLHGMLDSFCLSASILLVGVILGELWYCILFSKAHLHFYLFWSSLTFVWISFSTFASFHSFSYLMMYFYIYSSVLKDSFTFQYEWYAVNCPIFCLVFVCLHVSCHCVNLLYWQIYCIYCNWSSS